jgi:hypothetical protein
MVGFWCSVQKLGDLALNTVLRGDSVLQITGTVVDSTLRTVDPPDMYVKGRK